MTDRSDETRDRDLVETVRRLTAASEQIARSLASLEAKYAEECRNRESERAESKEWKKKFDAGQEERQQRMKPFHGSGKLAGLGPGVFFQVMALCFFIALAALAVAQCIQVARH